MSTSQEVASLVGAGQEIASAVSTMVPESVLYGAYLIFMIFAAIILHAKRERTKAHIIMFSVSTIMFAMSTTLWTFDIINIVLPLHQMFSYTDTQAAVAKNFSNINETKYFLGSIIFTLEFIMGDAVIAWRACAIWNMNKRIILFFGTMLSLSLTLTCVYVGCVGVNDWDFLDRPASCQDMVTAAFFVSVASNLASTCMIGLKAWHLRKDMRASNKDGWSSAGKVVLLLVESGFIWLVIWLSQCFTYLPVFTPSSGTAAWIANNVLNSVGNQIVGLYPAIVIVLVHHQYTIWDTSNISLNGDVSPNVDNSLGDMQFMPQHTSMEP
ncbi:uncharacterized protein STEHIDRAFT_162561 [Stereum hirsutum FP-91666 SS1]|uniref:uncharacterized protein n=1 Tax=Stereum hirsutum (strain FP-91666) TaxID=721885 RepID=UPI0004449F5E|nr:uncharacterized protein STEHIDRAFT_162561 [Stereum hirsutum FP-91666 SS1]EIM80791.1 hypothetical protein STEHIDRAFT_162561 [Stereum hirsutum FP-91666 SS1]